MALIIIGIVFILLGLLLFAATGKILALFVAGIGVYEICVGVKRRKAKKASAEQKTEPVAVPETKPVQKVASSKPKAVAVDDDEEDNGENIKVAGVSFRQDAIKSFAEENPDYDLSEEEIIEEGLEDKVIYEYTFPVLPATFQFEPENQYDPNAIAIYVEGVQIGYVKKGSTAHIRKLIENDRIVSADCTFRGGNGKIYYKDTEDLEEFDGDFSAKIHLTLKD